MQGANLAAFARSPRFANYSPARAAFFAVIPGIGAVYNRQYVKAITHFGLFAAIVILADYGPDIFGLAAFAFYVFTIIDAYRSAQIILRQGVTQPGFLDEEAGEEVKLPIWGSALILLGILFFLNNLGVVSLRSATHFAWPLLFVAAGVYLILYYFFHRSDQRDESRSQAGAATQVAPSTAPRPPVQPSSGGSTPAAGEKAPGSHYEDNR
ncbi:MAG: LiaI-LiaF-like domain-containing protein [Acidobacteriota bacterium]